MELDVESSDSDDIKSSDGVLIVAYNVSPDESINWASVAEVVREVQGGCYNYASSRKTEVDVKSRKKINLIFALGKELAQWLMTNNSAFRAKRDHLSGSCNIEMAK